jgi:phospholipid/cholesterol/gamma-HCH transport system substrate-binding protein
MSTAVRVGVFSVLTVLGIFVVWYILGNVSLRRNSYQIGIHFSNVVGLQPGSDVQLAGVDIGIVDDIKLLPDQTATVVCSIHSENTLYRGSIFTVTQTLTGSQSTLAIIPPRDLASAVPLPKRILPEAEQPEGTVPPTIADLLNEGQKRLLELDKTLAIVNTELPGIVRNFNGVAVHTDSLIVHADKNFNQLGQQLNMTVASVNGVVSQLNGLLAVNGRNITDMTTGMRQLLATNGPKVAGLIENLSATAANLNKTMASVQSIASDPNLKANLVATTANLKDSSEKLKEIATNIQDVTGDPKIQAELKSTVQNLDETIAKANDILGNFSTAQGAGPNPPGAGTPGASPVPYVTPLPGSHQAAPQAASFHMGSNGGLSQFDLISGQVRLYWNYRPQGALSDVNFTLLPRFPTHLTFGVEGLGSTTTYDFLVGRRASPSLDLGFGVLHSQLGLRTNWQGLGPFGARADLYNSKQPQLDLYGDLRLAQRLQFYYGEQALMGPAANRSPQLGIQLGY